eukprot:132833-Prorocentrum_minimum.AAC.1
MNFTAASEATPSFGWNPSGIRRGSGGGQEGVSTGSGGGSEGGQEGVRRGVAQYMRGTSRFPPPFPGLANRSPSIGIYRIHRPIAIPQ